MQPADNLCQRVVSFDRSVTCVDSNIAAMPKFAGVALAGIDCALLDSSAVRANAGANGEIAKSSDSPNLATAFLVGIWASPHRRRHDDFGPFTMYIPPAFAESDLTRLHDFIEQNSFGLLVSQVDGRPFASHVPFLLERQEGLHGTLIGHLARANPQWERAGGQDTLAIFSGPHVYVSRTWYEAEQVVPTWNYVAVHAYGRFQIVDDEPSLLQIVQRSVRFYEHGMARPWLFDASTTFIKRMLAQIVGFRIEIEKIEGKWKLNQNHPAERRQKVVEALSQRDDDNSQSIAAMMQEMLASKDIRHDDHLST